MTRKAISHMKRQLTILIISFLLFILIGATGCSKDEQPQEQPKTVSQKITVAKDSTGKIPAENAQTAKIPAEKVDEKAKPIEAMAEKTDEQAKPIEAMAEKTDEQAKPIEAMAEKTDEQAKPIEAMAEKTDEQAKPIGAMAEKVNPPEAEKQLTSDLIQESLKIASSYDAAGRFDPFKPLFGQQQEEPKRDSKSPKKTRVPQTPLERVSLSQLKVTAIIRAPSGNRALVEDATGKGYVVRKGTYIGLHSGQVVNIDKDTVFIEEEIEDIMGELKINNAEIKLQKPAGEL